MVYFPSLIFGRKRVWAVDVPRERGDGVTARPLIFIFIINIDECNIDERSEKYFFKILAVYPACMLK